MREFDWNMGIDRMRLGKLHEVGVGIQCLGFQKGVCDTLVWCPPSGRSLEFTGSLRANCPRFSPNTKSGLWKLQWILGPRDGNQTCEHRQIRLRMSEGLTAVKSVDDIDVKTSDHVATDVHCGFS